MTPEKRASLIVLRHARDVYQPRPRVPATIPVDVRCPGCGRDREGCDHPYCSRYLSPGEE